MDGGRGILNALSRWFLPETNVLTMMLLPYRQSEWKNRDAGSVLSADREVEWRSGHREGFSLSQKVTLSHLSLQCVSTL